MNEEIKFWIAVTVAVISSGALIYDKISKYLSNKLAIQKEAEVIFSHLLKIYFSYLKHKNLFQEENDIGLLPEVLDKSIPLLDTFSRDVDEFKEFLNSEVHLIPEVRVECLFLFDLLERFKLVDKLSEINPDADPTEGIPVKKAQFYSFEEYFENLFTSLFDLLRSKIRIDTLVLDDIKEMNSESHSKEIDKQSKIVIERYFESLKRQGVVNDEMIQAVFTSK